MLLVAFVIVVAAESYGTASQAADTEASRIDHLYEVADFAPDAQRQRIQAAAVCYTRAVHAHEWPAMADGGGTSPKVSVWSSRFRTSFKELVASPDERFSLLSHADDDRSTARHARLARLAEATPAIPTVVYWFMVVSLAATIGAFAYGLPEKRGRGHLILMGALAILFTGSLLLIQDIDRPFDGQIRITDTARATPPTTSPPTTTATTPAPHSPPTAADCPSPPPHAADRWAHGSFGDARERPVWTPAPSAKTIARYGRVDLLCIDELGYLELDRRAEMLFQVVTEREEKNSVAIASNESFGKAHLFRRTCARQRRNGTGSALLGG